MDNIGCITISAQGEKRPSSTPQLRAEGEEEVSAKGGQMAANHRAAEGVGGFTLGRKEENDSGQVESLSFLNCLLTLTTGETRKPKRVLVKFTCNIEIPDFKYHEGAFFLQYSLYKVHRGTKGGSEGASKGV